VLNPLDKFAQLAALGVELGIPKRIKFRNSLRTVCRRSSTSPSAQGPDNLTESIFTADIAAILSP
jgi:hypothetical protein